jgi:hypothetical protein
MKIVAAYLLAHLGGNASPAAADINKILSSGACASVAERSPSSCTITKSHAF